MSKQLQPPRLVAGAVTAAAIALWATTAPAAVSYTVADGPFEWSGLTWDFNLSSSKATVTINDDGSLTMTGKQGEMSRTQGSITNPDEWVLKARLPDYIRSSDRQNIQFRFLDNTDNSYVPRVFVDRNESDAELMAQSGGYAGFANYYYGGWTYDKSDASWDGDFTELAARSTGEHTADFKLDPTGSLYFAFDGVEPDSYYDAGFADFKDLFIGFNAYSGGEDISVTFTGVSATTPLPAAAWFLLTALGGLFGARWAKRRASEKAA
ncbi:VPLPA-CTERM sorting domain-containing protein [uncultured Rhodospira sp.]|uniref:VPLPA-CTERM sorting domain-containing protein n=1 Tax=uncultured Rhodospira sp. TaxID=1936189 RepID=UPI0026064F2B|nr:VPLPA-CTERM sorting domain-containing protein [uncultured Rhodospira sp.]